MNTKLQLIWFRLTHLFNYEPDLEDSFMEFLYYQKGGKQIIETEGSKRS